MAKKHKHLAETVKEPSLPMDEDEQYNEPQTELQEEEKQTKKESKKKLKREQKLNVRIVSINEHPEKSLPLVGYFPSGYNPLKNNNNASHQKEQQPRVRVLKNMKRSNRFQVVVSPNESQVEFVGTNYSGEATAPQVCNYALGVFDKQAQTLKIVQIEANKIFRLVPKIGGAEEPADKPSEGLNEELTAEEKSEKSLVFSTKKTIQRVKKERSLRRNEDPKSQEDLDKKMGTLKVNKEALEVAATAASNARNIPPHDMSSTKPQEAYPLEKIIFKGEWDFLLDIVELLRAGNEVSPCAYPVFVCNRIHKLEVLEDEVVKETLACIFSYITHLIKYKDKNSGEGFSSAKNHKFPSILTQKFNTMFGNPTSKWLSDDKRSLLISYVLVLTLFADNFKTDPSDIAKDLRMSNVQLRPHFEYLGCKFVREDKIMFVTLPAPLRFPEPRGKRRR